MTIQQSLCDICLGLRVAQIWSAFPLPKLLPWRDGHCGLFSTGPALCCQLTQRERTEVLNELGQKAQETQQREMQVVKEASVSGQD